MSPLIPCGHCLVILLVGRDSEVSRRDVLPDPGARDPGDTSFLPFLVIIRRTGLLPVFRPVGGGRNHPSTGIGKIIPLVL